MAGTPCRGAAARADRIAKTRREMGTSRRRALPASGGGSERTRNDPPGNRSRGSTERTLAVSAAGRRSSRRQDTHRTSSNRTRPFPHRGPRSAMSRARISRACCIGEETQSRTRRRFHPRGTASPAPGELPNRRRLPPRAGPPRRRSQHPGHHPRRKALPMGARRCRYRPRMPPPRGSHTWPPPG